MEGENDSTGIRAFSFRRHLSCGAVREWCDLQMTLPYGAGDGGTEIKVKKNKQKKSCMHASQKNTRKRTFYFLVVFLLLVIEW